MKLFVEHLLHILTPRHTNNHKARILHPISLVNVITVFLVFQVVLTAFARLAPGVLGYASNISVSDLVKYTNDQRKLAGDEPVVLNAKLNAAAQAKAEDMFANQYWAHNSPSGKDPWSFILAAGYSYLFAGENLARDFADSKSVVDAWMKSPSHRENLINPRYKDVGFAVVNGKYNGYETTLVVQMFGTRPVGEPTVEETVALPIQPINQGSGAAVLNTETQKPNIKIDMFGLTKNLSLGVIVVLLGVLVVDSALVYKRRIVRISGHNFAHVLFLLAVLVVLNLIGRGIVV